MKISDERLAELRYSEGNPEVCICLAELQRSRALVTELRALAERMRGNAERISNSLDVRMDGGPDYDIDQREVDVTIDYLDCITSLLAAHDAQQAEGRE